MKKYILLWYVVSILSIFFLSQESYAYYAKVASYNVLDAANDNEGNILSDNTTAGYLGETSGQEREIAVRPPRDGDPMIIYIARGGTSTGDGRRLYGAYTTAGIAAIKCVPLNTSFNPNAPNATSNYIDTGIITWWPGMGGIGATSAGFASGIVYEPIYDRVWTTSGGASGTAAIVHFPGGTLGGAPNGGGISEVNMISVDTAFVGTGAADGFGVIRHIAVRVLKGADPSSDTVIVAVSASTTVHYFRSTTGLYGEYTRVWRSRGCVGWTGAPGSVTGISLDNNCDLWAVCPGIVGAARLYYFPANSSGNDVVPTAIDLPEASFVTRIASGTNETVNLNNIRWYMQDTIALIVGWCRGSDGRNMRHSVVRWQRTKNTPPYTSADFKVIDGFGQRVKASNMGDAFALSAAACSTTMANATATQPFKVTGNVVGLTFAYSTTGDLTLYHPRIYTNLCAIDADKGQTRPTSGVLVLTLDPVPLYSAMSSVRLGSITLGETGATIEILNVVTTGVAHISAISYPGKYPPGTTDGAVSSNIGNVNVIKRYYSISTSTLGTISSLSANLILSYSEEELNGIPEAELGALKSEDGGSSWVAVVSSVDTVNNTVVIPNIDSLSLWALGQSQGVPVELSNFEAIPGKKE